jgi:hypothetical protein
MSFFAHRVLRRKFGPKRDEVTGEWKRLPSEELNAAYSSLNIFRVNKPNNNELGWARMFWWRPEGKT